MKKAIVVHAGSRDNYQLALALNEKNLLEKLITDFYSPEILQLLSPYFKKRYKNGLPSKKVINSYHIVLNRILQKFLNTHQEIFYRKQDGKLSEKALKYALETDSNLFLYSYYAYEAFKKYNGENKKILFQVHPHPLTVRRILQEEMQLVPQAEKSLGDEAEMILKGEMLEQLIDEPKMADNIVVASSFTKTSLIENGIDEKIIKVIPYGVDFSKFNSLKKEKRDSGNINLIFVGNIIQRKGVSYILDAMRLLKSNNIYLTLIGRKADKELLKDYSDMTNIKIKINVSQKELSKELSKSDVFIFPSLVEGFALVILEAMASGLPVITTNNTSGADIIKDGKEGYIVPIRSAESIAGKIEQFIADKNCFEMGLNAEKKAKEYTWEKFRAGILMFYNYCND